MDESEQPRTVYLVTYSQADLEKVACRSDFAHIVVDEFNQHGKFDRVVQWACCKESHRVTGVHYHLAIKLSGVFRWKQVKNNIISSIGIVVHFRTFSTGYHDAYKYVTKSDRMFITSKNHPLNLDVPKTQAAMETRSRKRTATFQNNNKSKQPKRLTPTDLYDIIIKKNIKTDMELCHLANEEREKENPALATFVLAKDEKRRNSLIATSWKMRTATATLQREAKSRLELLSDCKTLDCVAGCLGQWLHQAEHTLALNNIDKLEFSNKIYEAIEKGRGKNRNILLVGNSNCGKTFLLKPLTKIFQTFQAPATSTFNWVGAEKAECVFLNDFRWSERIISWGDFLNLLEGEPIHIPVPKTHFAQDVLWTKDTPILATSKSKTRKYERGEIDEIETEMMDSRWKVFLFRHQFSKENIVDLLPCPRCFAELVLSSQSA